MDEAVWAAIGIISAILTLAIIISILLRNDAEVDIDSMQTSLYVLSAQCDQVCSLPENTALSVQVTMLSDTVLSVDGDRICIASSADPSVSACERCECKHTDSGDVLDLSEAGGFFKSHTYSCRYTRADTGNTARRVDLECSG